MTIQNTVFIPQTFCTAPTPSPFFQYSYHLPIAPSTTPTPDVDTQKTTAATPSKAPEEIDDELIFQFDEETLQDFKKSKEAKEKRETFNDTIISRLSSIATTEQNSPASSPEAETILSDEEET